MKLAPYGSTQQMLAKMGQTATALTVNFLLILIVPLRLNEQQNKIPRKSWKSLFADHSGPLFIEGLRMTSHILLWSLVFIIPGIYKQIKYLFVPFIVLIDPQYLRGKVDPLKRSSELTKGLFIILFVTLLANFLTQMLFEFGDHFLLFPSRSIFLILKTGFILLSKVYFCSIFYFIFYFQITKTNGAINNRGINV